MTITDDLHGCFLTFHALAGNAPHGALPDTTDPALIQVRPVVVANRTPGVIVTTSCYVTESFGLACDDAVMLGERLRELLRTPGKGRTAGVMGPDLLAWQAPRVGVAVTDGQAVFHAGPAYLIDDAEGLAAALIVSAMWAEAAA